VGTQRVKGALAGTVDGIGPFTGKVLAGRFERSRSALTSVRIFPEPSEPAKGGAASGPDPFLSSGGGGASLPPHSQE
jgi:hypothetical protein